MSEWGEEGRTGVGEGGEIEVFGGGGGVPILDTFSFKILHFLLIRGVGWVDGLLDYRMRE